MIQFKRDPPEGAHLPDGRRITAPIPDPQGAHIPGQDVASKYKIDDSQGERIKETKKLIPLTLAFDSKHNILGGLT